MSCLRASIEGEGLDKIIKLSEENEERNSEVTINGKVYALYDVRLSNDCFCFVTGWSNECCDEIEDIRKNIAFSAPGTTFNYFKHSTYTGLDNSFNFGYIDGEYREFEDFISRAYHDVRLECDGIGLIPTYGETDKWGCTKAVINGNEFWLNELNYSDNHIMFDEAVNGSHNSDGLIEELAKAVGGKTVTVTRTDFCTGEELLYMYYYEEDTDEVIVEECF